MSRYHLIIMTFRDPFASSGVLHRYRVERMDCLSGFESDDPRNICRRIKLTEFVPLVYLHGGLV